MNLFPPHFKSFYWIFSCVCYKVFVPTSFTFFGVKKIQSRVCHKKGEHMWTHKGIMQNIGGYWQTNFHGNRKKSWVNIDYYLYNAHVPVSLLNWSRHKICKCAYILLLPWISTSPSFFVFCYIHVYVIWLWVEKI